MVVCVHVVIPGHEQSTQPRGEQRRCMLLALCGGDTTREKRRRKRRGNPAPPQVMMTEFQYIFSFIIQVFILLNTYFVFSCGGVSFLFN